MRDRKPFSRRDVVPIAPFVLGLGAMIWESQALDNTRGGLRLFWCVFAPAACVGFVLGYRYFWKSPRAGTGMVDRLSEPLMLLIGFGLFAAAAVSSFNRVGVTTPRRTVSVSVIEPPTAKQPTFLFIDWNGDAERLYAPRDLWCDAPARRTRGQLQVFTGRLGLDVAECISFGGKPCEPLAGMDDEVAIQTPPNN